MQKQKTTSTPPVPPSAPLRSFRSAFPTMVQFMRRLNYKEGNAWPTPEELSMSISEMCQTDPELMGKALALYQRAYEYASKTTFRMAIYQFYATLCELPPYKTAFPKSDNLWTYLGSPTGSIWPDAERVQGQIENKSNVNIHTLQRAMEIYAKGHGSLGSGSCAEVLYQMHKILSED